LSNRGTIRHDRAVEPSRRAHLCCQRRLRETAYAIALEVAAADREVKAEETRFLEMLSDNLELDKLTTAGIERGIRARNLVL